MSMKAAGAASVCVWLFSCSLAAPACSAGCAALDPATRAKIASKAFDIFALPLNANLSIGGEAMDAATCWTQFNLSATISGIEMRRTLFLSPDHRFLVTTAYDIRKRPASPIEVAPIPRSSELLVPGPASSHQTLSALLISNVLPSGGIGMAGGSAVISVVAASGPFPDSLHPRFLVSFGPPRCEPPAIRLAQTSGFTSRPTDLVSGGLSRPVNFELRTAPTNQASGRITIPIHASPIPPAPDAGSVHFITADETVTIEVSKP